MPSRTRILFVDPAVAPDIGAVHQGKMALHSLHQWAERCTGCKIARPPGNLAERARFYWNRVPGPLRKRAQLYIIRERRDTPWRFSDANPWRRGLRPVLESKPRPKSDWASYKPSAYIKHPVFGDAPSIAETAAQAGEAYLKGSSRRKKLKAPQVQAQPKERLKVGIWS